MVAYVRPGKGTGLDVQRTGAGNNWAWGGPEQTLHSLSGQIELSHVSAVAGSSRQRAPRFLPAPARPHCILLCKKYSLCPYPWLDECDSGVLRRRRHFSNLVVGDEVGGVRLVTVLDHKDGWVLHPVDH